MSPFLQELKLVDLNHSVLDEENSNPADGRYEFVEKKYVSYQNPEVRPPWYFSWCRYVPQNNFKEFNEWKWRWKFDKVTVEDGYWPEGLAPDANGVYTTGDVILVKCPLSEYIKRRKHEIGLSEGSTKAIVSRFKEESKLAGVSLDDALIRSL